jgi:hypothetical protein
MSTHRSTWKRRERDAARLFGAERQPLSGSGGRADQTRSDSTHPRLSIETKLRASSSVRSLWDETRRRARLEGKVPVLMLYAKGKTGGLVVCHEGDLAELLEAVAAGRPGAGNREGDNRDDSDEHQGGTP